MVRNVLKVYRHELKFMLSQIEYVNLKCLLAAAMNLDENAQSREEYYIRSLYFDTMTDADYASKIMGISERRKIRLRIYDTETDRVKLEIKNKQSDYSVKETVTISREDAQELAMHNYQALLKYDDSVSNKAYHNFMLNYYMPKIIVDYDREAYMLPVENIRITFDKKVRAAKASDLFCPDLPTFNLLSEQQVILEVKYNKYIPRHICNILSGICMQRMSISKYCMARELVG